MDYSRPATGNRDTAMRWTARLLSLATNTVFLLILVLAVTNEDKPQGAAIAVLVLLVAAMASCAVAWRWERAGGIAVLVTAVCLGIAAAYASRSYGLSPSFLAPVMYAVPFLIVGTLFLLAARSQG